MNLPTIRQMQYLVALKEELSFSRAAHVCAVTQSTLSAGIKELENILGHPVIDRSKRKVIFTALGQDIVQESRDIIEKAQRITERANQLSAPMTGPMRLGVIPTIAPYLLPDILPVIKQKYPHLELQLYEDMSERLIDALRRGDIDVALIAFPFDTPDTTQKLLFEEDFFLAVPRGRPMPFDIKNIKPDDLDPGELLLLEEGHCLSDHALSACGLQLPKRRKAYSATSLSTLLQMVASGYGITLVPDMAVKARTIPHNVDILNFANPSPRRQIGFCWRPGSPRIQDFLRLGKLVSNSSVVEYQLFSHYS